MAHVSNRRDHAVVVGAGIAGLMAARALRRHFERVTVLEASGAADDPIHALPQAPHGHIFFEPGQRILGALFPELGSGAVRTLPHFDLTGDFLWYNPFGVLPRFASGERLFSCTRARLDAIVREALLDDAGVSLHAGHRALEPLADGSGLRGVRAATGDGTLDIEADLVVDAGGRRGLSAQWLRALGLPAVPVQMVPARVVYSSCTFRLPAGGEPDFRVLFVQRQRGRDPRGTLTMAVEDGRWLVTLVAGDGSVPARDLDEFHAFARKVRAPELASLLDGARALTPVRSFGIKGSRMNRYDDAPRWPRRLVALGDTVCAFNPIYGQGMTAAAFGAELLDRCLAGDTRAGWERRFQQRLHARLTDAWQLSVGQDLRWAGVRRSLGARVAGAYLERLMRRSLSDRRIHAALVDVLQLRRPLVSLFSPGLAVRATALPLRAAG